MIPEYTNLKCDLPWHTNFYIKISEFLRVNQLDSIESSKHAYKLTNSSLFKDYIAKTKGRKKIKK